MFIHCFIYLSLNPNIGSRFRHAIRVELIFTMNEDGSITVVWTNDKLVDTPSAHIDRHDRLLTPQLRQFYTDAYNLDGKVCTSSPDPFYLNSQPQPLVCKANHESWAAMHLEKKPCFTRTIVPYFFLVGDLMYKLHVLCMSLGRFVGLRRRIDKTFIADEERWSPADFEAEPIQMFELRGQVVQAQQTGVLRLRCSFELHIHATRERHECLYWSNNSIHSSTWCVGDES